MKLPVQEMLLFLISWAIVAFGQPAWLWWLGPLAGSIGFALFMRLLFDVPAAHMRFLLGTSWFMSVQLLQLSWGVSHPFWYIYAVYLLICLSFGMQFGFLSLLVTPERLARWYFPALLAGAWVLMEWARLFIFSGFSWNPVGLALSGSTYTLQVVSLIGVYGLSFWVIFVNALSLRLWMHPPTWRFISVWALALLSPYLFGAAHVVYHDSIRRSYPEGSLRALLVQPFFPVEEWLPQFSPRQAFSLALEEWGQILSLLKAHMHEEIDIVVMPENVVPFAAYSPVYAYSDVKTLFRRVLGADSLAALPDLETGAALSIDTPNGRVWAVTNGYIVQAMANLLHANVVAGLEDHEPQEDGNTRSTASAFYFTRDPTLQERYDKRVLVPMGEYIPFAIVRPFVEQYGIHGSFTPGSQAKVINCRDVAMGISICYEETYGHLMRENRLLGAQVLLNLTNDGWYPNSRLPHQHFEHSRPRSVELGIPLVRACNTGFTCVVDSLGRVVAALDDINSPGVLKVDVPLYHYPTLYSQYGDGIVVGASLAFVLPALLRRRKKKSVS